MKIPKKKKIAREKRKKRGKEAGIEENKMKCGLRSGQLGDRKKQL